MVVKTLEVFYGGDCLPYKDQERQVHYPIVEPAFQGASQVNTIRFYVDEIGGTGLQWVALAKLPNGKISYKVLSTSTDGKGGYAILSLTSWYTQMAGDLYISIRGYEGVEIAYDDDTDLYTIEGNPVIQSTGSIKLTIKYATPLLEDESEDEYTQQEILAAIGNKMNKNDTHYLKVVTNISAINSAEYADYLLAGDYVLSKADNKTYVLSSAYPTLIATRVILDNNQVVKTSAGDIVYSNDTDGNQVARLLRIAAIGSSVPFRDGNGQLNVPNTPTENYHAASKYYVDTEIGKVKQNEITLVDTNVYTTLSSFLASTGEEGYIYLYPIDATDLSKGYYRYVWEDNSWLALGTTEIDLSDYYTKEEADAEFVEKTNVAYRLYGTGAGGTPTLYTISAGYYEDTVPLREENGNIRVGTTPVLDNHATSKVYVDTVDALKADKVGPLPSYTVNGTDNVLDFITNNNASGKPICIDLGGNNQYIGEMVKLGGVLHFEFEKIGIAPYVRYTGNINVAVSTPIFNDLLSNTYINNYEENNNKVTSLSGSSTNTQYPSAKCVYDITEEIREVAEGKCATYCLSYNDTIASVKARLIQISILKICDANGNDITEAFKNGDYDSLISRNSVFNSQDDNINVFSNLSQAIIVDGSKYDYIYMLITFDDALSVLRRGDIFLVYETDVPDRWYNNSTSFWKLETSKIDLTNYYTKDADLIPSTTNAYDIGSSSYTWKDIYLSGNIQVASGTSIKIGNATSLEFGNYTFSTYGFKPFATNGYDIGTSSKKYKDFYLAGTMYGATYSASIDEMCSQFNYNTTGTTEIKWTQMLSFLCSVDTTFTFETAKTSCLNEYKAIITNSGASTITLTFTGVSNILCNDDNCVVTNGTNSTLTLPTSVSIEISVVNGKLVAINFEAE